MAIALSRAGYSVDKLIYRSNKPSSGLVEEIEGRPEVLSFDEVSILDSDLILITTADTELASASSRIAPKVAENSVLLHTSGALSSEVLLPAAERGIATGSVHPLVSVSDPVIGAGNFAGAFYCIEGAPAAVSMAKEIVHSLGGTSFSIDTKYKPLYHASAVMASGHLTSLFAAAMKTLSGCGVDSSKAKDILLPLAESALSNLSKQHPASALTGPFARTDLDAVQRHLDAFDRSELEAEKRIYLELGLKALRLAELSGGDAENILRIRDVIKLAQDWGK